MTTKQANHRFEQTVFSPRSEAGGGTPAPLGIILRTVAFGIVLLTSMTGCASHLDVLATGHWYRWYFPHITLATSDGERIESVEVIVSCGRFRALTGIPNDWSAELVSPMSEKNVFGGGMTITRKSEIRV